MSICRGIAGRRGRNPVGIFLHNDAGSQNANSTFYRKWLQTHPLEDGFAHYYVASDGTLQAEDDAYCAWHCGNTYSNQEYLGIEMCQSMGDINIFKSNEEKALILAAQKCKQYGIVPSNSTIRLHQEVYATSCPHRSVEIHGGRASTKAYFINRIKELMSAPVASPTQTSSNPINNLGLYYRAHVQSLGWLSPVHDGQVAGTTGHSLRLEALMIDTRKCPGLKIKAKAHIQGIGTVDYGYITHETVIGTVGQSRRLEAIMLETEGLPEGKKLYIQMHFAKDGWGAVVPNDGGSFGVGKETQAIKMWIA